MWLGFWEFHILLLESGCIFTQLFDICFLSRGTRFMPMCPCPHVLVYEKLSHSYHGYVRCFCSHSVLSFSIKVSFRIVVIVFIFQPAKLLTYMHFLFRGNLLKHFCHSPILINQQQFVILTWNHSEWLSKKCSWVTILKNFKDSFWVGKKC